MDAATIGFLVAAAFIAAFVDSIVGGGGVITLPALLATGMDPHLALGTNKLAATGASGIATMNYVRHGAARSWLVLPLAGLAGLGSLFGARTVLGIPDRTVTALVVVAVIAMVAYVLLRPSFGRRADGAEPDRLPGERRMALALLALAVGFYDGFLGPGTGSFLLFGIIAIGGLGFLKAAAHGRVLNFASNAAALVYFAAVGEVAYTVGLPMMAATIAGGFIGSRFGIRHGARLIRPLFVVMGLALAARLVWDLT